MNILNLIRPEILNLEPYQAKNRSAYKILLDGNESPYPPSSKIKDLIKTRLDSLDLNRYPDPEAKILKEDLAKYYGVETSNIILGNGSDELILYLILAFCNNSDSIICPSPTFAMYKILAQTAGTQYIEIPLDQDFDLECNLLIDTIEEKKSKLLFLASPNNPTGNTFSSSMILDLLNQKNCIVVLDEAYGYFCKKSFLKKLDKYDNLIILKTFSKIGLAGLRFGVLICNEHLIKEISKVRLPFNVNSFSQMVTSIILENTLELEKDINIIIKERDFLFSNLNSIKGVTPYPTEANFILFKSNIDVDIVYNELVNKGILVRNFKHPRLKNSLRVTVGLPEENKKFIEGLTDIFNEIKISA
ncbi:MAG: histidinol-phosphate transaminase [bacterium]